jgi:hypothetical protein
MTLSPVARWKVRPYPAEFTASIGIMSVITPFSITMSTGPSGGMARFVPGVPRPVSTVAPRMINRLTRSPRVVPSGSVVGPLFGTAITSRVCALAPDEITTSPTVTRMRIRRSPRCNGGRFVRLVLVLRIPRLLRRGSSQIDHESGRRAMNSFMVESAAFREDPRSRMSRGQEGHLSLRLIGVESFFSGNQSINLERHDIVFVLGSHDDLTRAEGHRN